MISAALLICLLLLLAPCARQDNPYSFARRLCMLPSLAFYGASAWSLAYYGSDAVQKSGTNPVAIVGGLTAMVAVPVLYALGSLGVLTSLVVFALEVRWNSLRARQLAAGPEESPPVDV